jgi:drug/metabolite transporter (DMT)-like permease
LIWLRMIVSRWRFIAAGVGFLGVLLMLNPSAFHWEWASFAALGTGLCSSIAFVGVRQLSKVQTAGIILFYYFGAATIISFFPCMYTWEPLEHKILWFYLVCIGVLGLLFQYFMTLSFSLAPVSKAGLTTYLGVLFGGLFGWWIWDEVPSLWSAAGIILTIGGGVLAVLDKRAPRKL